MAMGNGQSPTYRWFSFLDFTDIFFSLGPKPVFFTGHSRILNRRYLPYIIYQAYIRILKFPLVFQMVFQCFSQPSMEIFQPCWMTTVAIFFWMAWAPSSQACQEQVQVGETGCQDILKPKVVSSDIAGFRVFVGDFMFLGGTWRNHLTSNQSGFIHVQAWNIHQSSASQAGYIDAKNSKHQSDIAVAQTQGSSSMQAAKTRLPATTG